MELALGDIDASLRRRSLELILDGARWSVAMFGHFFVIWLLAWIQSQAVGLVVSVAWATVISLVIVFQAMYASRWQPERLDALNDVGVQQRLKVFTASAWMVGACWAAGGLLLYPPDERELQLFLVFVMGGMSLAAVGTQHVYLPACYGSMGFAVPVLALRYAIDGNWVEPVLLVLYTAVIIRLARMLSRFSLRTIRLQHERDQLLLELTDRARDLDKARLEAEEANLAKSRFLAQASHDLRQPLHAIGLFVESLAGDRVTVRIDHVVNRVRESLGMLSSLFDSLLDVTVLDAGNTQAAKQVFAVQELFQQLEKDFDPIASEANVSLKFVRTSAVANTDPVLFRRLLQNLVSNAIRYAPGGRVVVGMRRDGTSWTVDVVDNGPGIPEADQRRIFQEFVKLEGGRKTTTQGLGLGLSIVDRLARILELSISLESEEGRGTRFRIGDLPRGYGPAAKLTESEDREVGDLLAETRVLVVDDDPEILAATGTLLRRWGCEVETSATFPENVPAVDVVLSDYELEDVDGLECLIALRAHRPSVQPVLVSGNSTLELRDRAAAAEIALLHKPVRPVKLRSLLLHLLSQEA